MDFILNALSYVVPILGAIMLLVFVHEMGHFLFAKLFKMRVERFSIGFPPKIASKQIGETEYVLAATPLGGYVKIAGMVDESLDADFLESEPQPWEFRSKPVWQRILVITAGVIFNMILAAIVFISLKAIYGEAYVPPVGDVFVADSSLAYNMGLRTGDRILDINGKPVQSLTGLRGLQETLLADPLLIHVRRDSVDLTLEGPKDIMTQLSRAGGNAGMAFDPAVVGGIVPGSAAEALGLLPGDNVKGIDSTKIRFWHEMTKRIQNSDGAAFELRWERPDSLAAAPVPPTAVALGPGTEGGVVYEAKVTPAPDGDRYVLGIYPLVRYVNYGFGDAIASGVADTWINTRLIATSLKRVVTGQDNWRENLGGPIMVAKTTKDAYDQGGMRSFWNIVAMLSITLAIINILPIPALDGGHLVFLVYEGITRREPSVKVRMWLQQVGMILLLALMTFLVFNDILRL